MSDLLLRNLDPDLKRRLQEQARREGRSLSETAKGLLDTALAKDKPAKPMGTALVEHFRGVGPVDLDIPRRDEMPEPPDFE